LKGIGLASLRVLIAGGGTGGHIIPALAVARELVARHSAEILFVGTERGLETRLVPGAGFPLHLIQVGPLNKVSLATRMRTLVDIPSSVWACRRLMKEWKPDVVLGIGGYASGPGVAAALLMHVPTLLFEPNAMPGLTNRLVGKRVQGAAVNFPSAAKWFKNAEVTGVPVRPEFFKVPPYVGPPRLLVFGGSQGARVLNVTMPCILKVLLDAVPELTVLHQCGARHAETTQAAFAATGADATRWQVSAFLDDMPAQFAQASLVLCRSGASTVAELAAAGRASLLVPFAAAADDHQTRNAEEMAKAGAAVLLPERELAGGVKLLETLTALLRNPERVAAMGEAARTQAHPGAAARIVDRLAELVKR
jgi:UDP-N-acetylglucosamine--N-acetylmuramyl-(pentapeptide) pyrophosphoryl-undecaprenol N-acetylglucosamine transferase